MQPTVLTAVPGDLVDRTLPVLVTLVCHVLLDATSKEALRCHSDNDQFVFRMQLFSSIKQLLILRLCENVMPLL